MEIMSWIDSRGHNPIEEFVLKLDKKSQNKTIKKLEMLSNYTYKQLNNGNGLFEKLKGYNNLYEIRIKCKDIWIRILCGVINQTIYMLHIFKKKQNKTPKNEIEIALNRQLNITKNI